MGRNFCYFVLNPIATSLVLPCQWWGRHRGVCNRLNIDSGGGLKHIGRIRRGGRRHCIFSEFPMQWVVLVSAVDVVCVVVVVIVVAERWFFARYGMNVCGGQGSCCFCLGPWIAVMRWKRVIRFKNLFRKLILGKFVCALCIYKRRFIGLAWMKHEKMFLKQTFYKSRSTFYK